MSFRKFTEYLAERTKHPHGVVSDDKGFANRDYDGGLSLKPKPGKYLQPQEYYAPGANKNPGLMTADGSDRGEPFGNMATPGLNPKNSMAYGEKPADKTKKIGKKGKKKLPTKKAMKVESFLDKTQGMTDVQFTKHLLEDVKKIPTPKVRDLYGKEFTPEPAQTMKYMTHLMLNNENMMSRMVREMKRNGGLHLLVAEVLSQPETYDLLNEAARGEFGNVIEKKMAMFFEGISPPRAGAQSPGPASAGSPGAQGGSFGGGGGAGGGAGGGTQGGPFAGGMANGGGDTITGGGGGGGMGAGGMPGMGEDEMTPDMGGMGMDDEHPEGDEEHDFDDDDDDDEDEGLDPDDEDDDDDDDDDDDLSDDDDEEGEEEDEEEDEENGGMSGPPPQGQGMGMGSMTGGGGGAFGGGMGMGGMGMGGM